MLGTVHRDQNGHSELLRIEPWTPWQPAHGVIPSGPKPPGTVWQVRSRSSVYRYTWQHCTSRRSCRWGVREVGVGDEVFRVRGHQVDFGPWNCVDREAEVRGGTIEFRYAYAVDVDFHVLSLLARQGSILRLPSAGGLSWIVDGEHRDENMKHVRLDTAGLSAGTHYIDRMSNGEITQPQLLIDVVEPVVLRASPHDGKVTFDPADDDSNGFVSDVVVRNRTTDQQVVSLEVSSSPPGWDAFLVNDPVVVLEPEEEATCQVQVELMSSIGVRRTLSPVVIRARTNVVSVSQRGRPAIGDLGQFCEIFPSVTAEDSEFDMTDKLFAGTLVL